VIDQSNFYDYPVARINEAPLQTNVHIVESSAAPGGVGEPGRATLHRGPLQCRLLRDRQTRQGTVAVEDRPCATGRGFQSA
jgi:hypothetical protein